MSQRPISAGTAKSSAREIALRMLPAGVTPLALAAALPADACRRSADPEARRVVLARQVLEELREEGLAVVRDGSYWAAVAARRVREQPGGYR
jgi:hypothetical protein